MATDNSGDSVVKEIFIECRPETLYSFRAPARGRHPIVTTQRHLACFLQEVSFCDGRTYVGLPIMMFIRGACCWAPYTSRSPTVPEEIGLAIVILMPNAWSKNTK